MSEYDHSILKKGIWIYFVLLIFEGSLRKWILPGLATPLLLIRDPLAIWLLLYSWKCKLLEFDIYIFSMVCIGFIGFFLALLIGHKNLGVAIFGTRILIFHFPLMFVIGKIFNRRDVISMGNIILYMAIPMTVLVAIQFYSPQSAWVNRGLGGDIGGTGASGAMGFFRPPATFSFNTGTVQFYSLVACFVFYFLFKPANINRLLLGAACICVIALIPLSISRTLLFQLSLTLSFSIVAALTRPKFLGRIIVGFGAVLLIVSVLGNLAFYNTAIVVFTDRFTSANNSEGGLEGVFLNRFLGGMISALSGNEILPFFGLGIGMGTNAGSKLLTGDISYLIAEGEWARLIGELGPLFGILVILIRSLFCFKLIVVCYKKLLSNDFLPWMLLSFGFLIILQGQWAQPTTLGFSTLAGGLILASLKGEN